MATTVRISTYTFDRAKRDELAHLRAEKRALWAAALAQEPGYLGELSIETEHGQQIVIHFWESPEAAEAAKVHNNPRLRQLVTEHVVPDYERLWTCPPEHVMGTVIATTVRRVGEREDEAP